MAWDVLIRGGTVVTPAGCAAADLAIADEVIAAIGPGLSGAAREVVDAAGCHLLPGGIDPHVHFNDPGRADWEGATTGSAALAAGGGTLFIDMPLNASPPTIDAVAFDAKQAAFAGVARTDFALWGGIVPGNAARLPELAARGVAGFKAFLCASGIDDFPAADDDTLAAGMRSAAALGLPVLVHAEDEATTAAAARAAVAAGRTSVRDYLASRPVAAEVAAIRRAAAVAAETGCRLHVVHVSSGAGVAEVAEARARGVDVTCETCPHYLVLTDADAERLGAVAKCAPPLRPAAVQAELWDALESGGIAFVASDHSPAPAALKRATSAFEIWGGISGVQATLGLVLEEAHARRGMPLERVAELTATAAARRFHLVGRGRLEPGAAADVAVVDLSWAGPLAAADLLDRHRLSPYIGRTLRGAVRRTLLRGHTIHASGRPVGPPRGRLVVPRRPGGAA